jgi:hypothetical protein
MSSPMLADRVIDIGHAHVLRFSKDSGDCAEDDESDAEPQIKALISDEARRDAAYQ